MWSFKTHNIIVISLLYGIRPRVILNKGITKTILHRGPTIPGGPLCLSSYFRWPTFWWTFILFPLFRWPITNGMLCLLPLFPTYFLATIIVCCWIFSDLFVWWLHHQHCCLLIYTMVVIETSLELNALSCALHLRAKQHLGTQLFWRIQPYFMPFFLVTGFLNWGTQSLVNFRPFWNYLILP